MSNRMYLCTVFVKLDPARSHARCTTAGVFGMDARPPPGGERGRVIWAGDASSKPEEKSRYGPPFRHIVAEYAVREALSRVDEVNPPGACRG